MSGRVIVRFLTDRITKTLCCKGLVRSGSGRARPGTRHDWPMTPSRRPIAVRTNTDKWPAFLWRAQRSHLFRHHVRKNFVRASVCVSVSSRNKFWRTHSVIFTACRPEVHIVSVVESAFEPLRSTRLRETEFGSPHDRPVGKFHREAQSATEGACNIFKRHADGQKYLITC